jgi:hypothetical protein
VEKAGLPSNGRQLQGQQCLAGPSAAPAAGVSRHPAAVPGGSGSTSGSGPCSGGSNQQRSARCSCIRSVLNIGSAKTACQPGRHLPAPTPMLAWWLGMSRPHHAGPAASAVMVDPTLVPGTAAAAAVTARPAMTANPARMVAAAAALSSLPAAECCSKPRRCRKCRSKPQNYPCSGAKPCGGGCSYRGTPSGVCSCQSKPCNGGGSYHNMPYSGSRCSCRSQHVKRAQRHGKARKQQLHSSIAGGGRSGHQISKGRDVGDVLAGVDGRLTRTQQPVASPLGMGTANAAGDVMSDRGAGGRGSVISSSNAAPASCATEHGKRRAGLCYCCCCNATVQLAY